MKFLNVNDFIIILNIGSKEIKTSKIDSHNIQYLMGFL